MHARERFALIAISLAALACCVLTIRRVPTPSRDGQLYASIVRARQLYGVGVPTVSWNSPVAVDHVPFYGPVFYDLTAIVLRLLGPKIVSFRVASVFGTLIFVLASALVARLMTDRRHGVLWAVTLLMLAPEITEGFPSGAMHMLALAGEMLALAVFIRGLVHGEQPVAHGVASGLLLATAALTTPRSYLFEAAFVCAGAVLIAAPAEWRRSAGRQFIATLAMLGVVMAVWATASHGTPLRWLRYMWFIFTHEDTDVAILSTSVRDWALAWHLAWTPLAAVVAGTAATVSVAVDWRERPTREAMAMAFGLATAWCTLVFTVVIMNLTFNVGEYFALPLFALALAVPRRHLRVSPRALAAGVAILMTVDAGLFALRFARAAATWAARDPTPLNDFIRDHVPAGSEVVGPEAPFFFPVERNGSRYRTVSPRSWADWARWVPTIEPEAVTVKRRFRTDPPVARFLMWPVDEPLPDGYDCVVGHEAATYRRPADHLNVLGPFGRQLDVGYPHSILYRLLSGCPHGYDPTAVQ